MSHAQAELYYTNKTLLLPLELTPRRILHEHPGLPGEPRRLPGVM